MKTITEMEWRELFAERVKYHLKRCNINQSQLARIINITEPTMSHYLLCKCTPRIDVIIRMAIKFGCSVDELINFGYVVMDK